MRWMRGCRSIEGQAQAPRRMGSGQIEREFVEIAAAGRGANQEGTIRGEAEKVRAHYAALQKGFKAEHTLDGRILQADAGQGLATLLHILEIYVFGIRRPHRKREPLPFGDNRPANARNIVKLQNAGVGGNRRQILAIRRPASCKDSGGVRDLGCAAVFQFKEIDAVVRGTSGLRLVEGGESEALAVGRPVGVVAQVFGVENCAGGAALGGYDVNLIFAALLLGKENKPRITAPARTVNDRARRVAGELEPLAAVGAASPETIWGHVEQPATVGRGGHFFRGGAGKELRGR